MYTCTNCGDKDFSYNNGKCMRCGSTSRTSTKIEPGEIATNRTRSKTAYIVTRDNGAELFAHADFSHIREWFLKSFSYSMSHALQYEGYQVWEVDRKTKKRTNISEQFILR